MSEVIEWLESPEGEKWSRERSEVGPLGCATVMRRDGPIDAAEDPGGRPHPRKRQQRRRRRHERARHHRDRPLWR